MKSLNKNYDRIIIFGDVHGCLDELKMSLDLLKYDPENDRVIFVGDLVDRGPNSGGVVQFVRKNNFECVCGNHDDKHIRYYKHSIRKKHNNQYKNPINLSEDKKRTHSQLSDVDLEWLSQLPKSIFIEKYNLLIIHAGVLPYSDPLNQNNDVYMYCRYLEKNTNKMLKLTHTHLKPNNSNLWADVYNGNVNIAYGHNVHSLTDPYLTINKHGYKTFGLDTGCVFGGKLTSFVIENDDYYFHQINAKTNYYKK